MMIKLIDALARHSGAWIKITFGLLILSGLYLACFYVPTPAGAFESFQKIKNDWPIGSIFRSIHKAGVSFLFALIYFNIGRGLYYKSYRMPCHASWMISVALLGLTMATAFTGYVLTWGQMSYWSSTVIMNLVASVPLFGEQVVSFLWGDAEAPHLNKIFLLHVLLPLAIYALIRLQKIIRKRKKNCAAPVNSEPSLGLITFLPNRSTLLYLVIFSLLACFAPSLLDHPVNDLVADPLTTPEKIIPEWYFMPFYAMLRSVEGDLFLPMTNLVLLSSQLCGAIVMFGSLAVLFCLPVLDPLMHGKKHIVLSRLMSRFLWLCLAFLWVSGGFSPSSDLALCQQLATSYFFFYFLIWLPLIGYYEKKCSNKA